LVIGGAVVYIWRDRIKEKVEGYFKSSTTPPTDPK
jgi:hypothetical protein